MNATDTSMADSNPHEFSYGQLVCFTPTNADKAILGRVLRRAYTISSGTGEDWQRNWEENDRPWLVCTGSDTVTTVLDRDLTPLREDTDLVIDPLRFGDTPESARTWFADYAKRLAESDEWGHRFGATADPHYWGVIDCRERIYWPAGSNPYMDDENYRLALTDGDYPSSDPMPSDEFLEMLYENEEDFRNNVGPEGDRDLIDAVKDLIAKPCYYYSINDVTFPTNDEGDYTGQIEHTDHSKLTDQELDVLALAICHVCEEADRLDDIVCLVEHRVYGLIPNALFLTKDEGETWLKDNRHNLTKDAHLYLMCDYRAPDFLRLSRNLRQIDWEHSTLAMRNPRPKYPN